MEGNTPVTATGKPEGAGAAGNQGGQPRNFTQEEVNALMGQVRAEERTKVAEKFSDYDYLKKRAGEADRQDKEKLTKEERLHKEAEEWKARAAQAEQRVAETTVSAEVRLRAVEKGMDPDVALALVNRKSVLYTPESGVTGVGEALDALLAAKPHLKLANPLVAPNMNPHGGNPPPSTPQLTPAARDVAHRMYPELSHTDAEVKYASGMKAS